MTDPDLFIQLLGHDAWTTRQILDQAAGLTDAQLDQEFDIGLGTVRRTLERLVASMELRVDPTVGQSARRDVMSSQPIADLADRYDFAMASFAAVARYARYEIAPSADAGDGIGATARLQPPGATVLDVIMYDHMRRSEVLRMFARLGVPNVASGDVLRWEAMGL